MSESRSEKAARYISSLDRHIEKATEHKKYSVDRFDILVISISTTSLVFSIGFVKDFVKENTHIEYGLLKTAWLFFTATIIVNLISQITGYYANDYDISVTKNILKEKRGFKMIGNQKKLIERCDFFSTSTQILNLISLMCILTGIITLIIFFSNNL